MLNLADMMHSAKCTLDSVLFTSHAQTLVAFHSYPENGVIQLLGKDVRPRARTVYQWHQLEPGMVVMVNYNPDDTKERGYWYDAEIQKKRETRTQREICAKILLG